MQGELQGQAVADNGHQDIYSDRNPDLTPEAMK
jgi:hypothetical protein